MVRRSAKQGSDPGGGLVGSLVALGALAAVVATAFRAPRRNTSAGGRGGDGAPAGDSDGAVLERIDVGGDPPKPPPAALRKVDHWQRQRAWAAFPVAVIRKFGDDRAGYLAALVAYFGFFSLFPLLLALTAILGFVLEGDPTLRERIQDTAFEQIPFIGVRLRQDVGAVTGSTIAVVVGVIGALWGGLRVVDAAQNALNEVWNVSLAGRPNMIKRRLRGVGVLVIIGIGLPGSVVAAGLGGLLPGIPGVGRVGILAATLALNFGVFLVCFQLLSQVSHPWRDLLPGAALAAVGWWALQTFGATYVASTLADAEGTYGEFATVIALLSFLFLVSQIVILGAEVNVVRARRLWPRSLAPVPGDLTDADRRLYVAYIAEGSRMRGVDLRVAFPPAPLEAGVAARTAAPEGDPVEERADGDGDGTRAVPAQASSGRASVRG